MLSRFFNRTLLATVSLLLAGVACADHDHDHGDAHAHAQSAAVANWTLDSSASSLSFVSVKAAQVVEAHSFGTLSGGVAVTALDDGSQAGEININIDLASVNTNIAVRDERMREHLFETAKYPVARVHGDVPVADYLALPAGSSTQSAIKLMLNLHGVDVPVTAEVLVSRLGDSRLLVASTTPVVLSAAGFNLVAGIEKLRELAGLPSIAGAVPVTFVLMLNSSGEVE